MSKKHWLEVPVFIHGITPENAPSPQGIRENYDLLFQAMLEGLKLRDEPGFGVRPIEIIWGFASGQTNEADNALAGAQLMISQRVIDLENKTSDFSLNPLRPLLYKELRRLLVVGMADLFYYVSQDGERAVRQHVFGHISEQVLEHANKSNRNISLTFITHSAGTIIAHDLLYHLFRPTDPTKVEVQGVRDLRLLAQEGRLRVRRFYSMGSPIIPTLFRSDSLLSKVGRGELLDPHDIGLRESDHLSYPRWVNFWDMDDIGSFPVEFLYKNPEKDQKKLIEDKYLDVGDGLPDKVHVEYWTKKALAQYIAETW